MKESLDREIQVVEHIIGQLKQCLAIYHKRKMFEEFKICLSDLQTCKTELQKLIAAQEAEKGAAKNVGEDKRGTQVIS
jgi:hypothetical protein